MKFETESKIFRELESPEMNEFVVKGDNYNPDETFTYFERSCCNVKLWRSSQRGGAYTSLDILNRLRMFENENNIAA